LFRNGFSGSAGNIAKSAQEAIARIDRLLADEGQRSADSLTKMVTFLFPLYPPERGHGDADTEYIARPQALFVDRGADYWRRYLAEGPVDDATSDQNALLGITNWKSGRPSDLVDRIMDPNRSIQIARFVGQFRGAELCRLLCDLTNRLAPQSATAWEHRFHAPGVAALCSMMRARPPEGDVLFKTISDIIKRTVAVNLPLANDIVYFFAGASSSQPALMSNDQPAQIAQALRDELLAHFVGEGAEDRLARALKDGSPWLIFWLTAHARGPGAESPLPFERWPEFADVLLRLAQAHPHIGVPLIVPFVSHADMVTGYLESESGEAEHTGAWVGRSNAGVARRLFPFDQLIPILAGFDVPNELEAQAKSCCQAAVEAAQAIASNAK
jgi:hypothetical protein